MSRLSLLVDEHGSPMALPEAPPRLSGHSPFFATQASPNRKQLYNFSASPARQLTPLARWQMDTMAQTLVANTGIAGVIRTLARTVGALRPQARTGNSKYDGILETAFASIAESPMIFDAAGIKDFYSYQVEATATRLIRGELYAVFTETSTGRARIAYRGPETVGGRPEGDKRDWWDGVLTNDDGFPLAYCFARKDGKKEVLDSRAVFHHANRHTLGAVRGCTALASSINDIIDMIETKAALKTAIKNSSEVAITRKQDVAHGSVPSSMGLSGPTSIDVFSPPDAVGTSVPDDPLPVLFEQYVRSGLFSSVPLDVLHDDRPSPNILAFHDSLKREFAHSVGVPHQLIFFMDDPGGAWSRILLEALVKFIGDQYINHQRPFCQRFWTYSIAKEIKAGRVPVPPADVKPENMFRVRWVPPRSMTADIGRIGRLTIEMRKALLTTFAAHFEELGLDWEDELRQGSQELKFLRDLEKEDGHEPGELRQWINPDSKMEKASPSALLELQESITALREELSQKPK